MKSASFCETHPTGAQCSDQGGRGHPEVAMDAKSSLHASSNGTLAWLSSRIELLEANEDFEGSYALTSEFADWLLDCPQPNLDILSLPSLLDGVT